MMSESLAEALESETTVVKGCSSPRAYWKHGACSVLGSVLNSMTMHEPLSTVASGSKLSAAGL